MIEFKIEHQIGFLALNRPAAANAFNEELLRDLSVKLKEIAHQGEQIRALVLYGKGRNFCAGADLTWMKSFADMSIEKNQQAAALMADMFETLYRLPMPTIAVVRGAAFGGAVGLIACCDMAIATEDVKLSLSEVKVGLIPAVILPYVARKWTPGHLRRFMLSGRAAHLQEAKEGGMIDRSCSAQDLNQVVREEIDAMLAAGPQAQRAIKQLYLNLADRHFSQGPDTAEAIAKIRIQKEAQEGIREFFNKQTPKWVAALPKDWRLYDN